MKTQNISAYPHLVKKRGGDTWPLWWLHPCDLLMIPPFEDRYNIYNKVAYHVITLHFLDGFEVIKLFLLDIAMFAKHEKILIFPVFSYNKGQTKSCNNSVIRRSSKLFFFVFSPSLLYQVFFCTGCKDKNSPPNLP